MLHFSTHNPGKVEKLALEKVNLGGELDPHVFLMCTIFLRTQLQRLLNAVEWVEAM